MEADDNGTLGVIFVAIILSYIVLLAIAIDPLAELFARLTKKDEEEADD